VVRGGLEFFGPPLQKFTGPLLRNFKHIIGILSSSPVDWDPFWAHLVKGGGSVDMSKRQAQVLGCRLRGDSSQ
jgi:hypothetical protein